MKKSGLQMGSTTPCQAWQVFQPGWKIAVLTCASNSYLRKLHLHFYRTSQSEINNHKKAMSQNWEAQKQYFSYCCWIKISFHTPRVKTIHILNKVPTVPLTFFVYRCNIQLHNNPLLLHRTLSNSCSSCMFDISPHSTWIPCWSTKA